jgi:2-keto-4-pentenoate hydratase
MKAQESHSQTTGSERERAIGLAAAQLHQAWCADQHCGVLDEAIRPLDRIEGYAAQAKLAALIGAPTIGWKIAATSAGGQRHIQVAAPLAGRLFANRALSDGGTVALGANAMRVAEAEFAFVMGRDLPAGNAGSELPIDQLFDHVAELHLAIEIPDSRFTHFTDAGEAQLIADFACARHFVLGAPVSADWRSMDLASHPLCFRIDGREVAQGWGHFALGDPRKALQWIAGELRSIGLGLKAGEVVLTGTCVVPVAIAPGQALCADFGHLGTVQAHTSA